MISPAMFRKFAKPYEQRLCARAHDLGLPYLMHICGKTNRILDDFAEMEFDAGELDFTTDVKMIHERLADRVPLFGTIDPTGVITDGTPALVAEKVGELKDLYEDSPRLVLAAGCAIPATAPRENIRALVETAQA
jgi:uroporphyrinogen decarboxylase